MYFTFESPFYLYFLFLVPLLIFFHFFHLKNPKSSSLKIANFEAIARVKGIDLYSKNIIYLLINFLFMSLLVLALSGLVLHKEMTASSFSYIIAIDSSQSMGADDLIPDRLTSAKTSSIEFIDALPYESNVGVVSFSGNTYIHKDLTKNKLDLKDSIRTITLTKFGGTDMFEAVSISINLLKNEENKAIILLSDGQINVNDIDTVIELARGEDTIIHTLGIGTFEGGSTAFGVSRLDEDILKSLAYSTGGKFFKIGSSEELSKSFEEIIPLTKKIGSINLAPYLLILLIFLFLAAQFYNKYKVISV